MPPGMPPDAPAPQSEVAFGPITIERSIAPEIDQPVNPPLEAAPPITAAVTGAPAAAPMGGSAMPTLDSVLADSNQFHAQAQRDIRGEKAAAAKYEASEKARIDEEARLKEEKATAEATALQDFAKSQRDIVTSQQMYKEEWHKRTVQQEVAQADYETELDAHRKAAHPTDLWGAAGLNPIFGTIGLALGQLGTFAGGTNTVMETIKMRASIRAQQLMAEGRALEMKGSQLARHAARSSEIYHSELAGSEKLQAALMNDFKTQLDVISNRYASPTARLKAQELKGAVDLHVMELNQKANNRAREANMQKLQADTDVAKLLAAAGAKNNSLNKTTEARVDKSIGNMITALEYYDQLKDTSSATTNPFERASAAQEYLSSAAMARGVPEGSLSRYLPKEYTGAGIFDPLATVPKWLGFIDKDRHLSAVVGSGKALDNHARSLVTRMDAIRRLSPVYEEKIRNAGVPTLAEFEKKYGLDPAGAINKSIADPLNFVDENEFKE